MPRRKLSKVEDTTSQQNPQKRMATEVPLILQLNDDCLWSIFSYFDLPELLKAANVCQRFEAIAQMFYRNYPSVDLWDLGDELNEKGLRRPILSEIFRQLEPHVVAMKVNGIEFHKGDIFSTSIFSNLKHLFLTEELPEIHEHYANVFPALEQIIIYGRDFNNEESYARGLNNENIAHRWFKNSPQLKILKFIDIIDMSGKCLVDLKEIEELKIYKCKSLQKKFFEHFCQMNPQLKKLSFSLRYHDIMTRKSFLESITKYLKNLESLVIQDNACLSIYDILRDLPKITKLHLNIDTKQFSDEYFDLLEHFAKNNHIEYLNLGYMSDNVLNILEQFPYLKVLKLRDVFDVGLGGLKFGTILNFLSCCTTTLEELHIRLLRKCASYNGLKEFIQQFQTLKLLDVSGSRGFKSSVLIDIEDCLQDRSQMLEITVNATPIAKELQEEPQSDILKGFLDRTKDKLKLTTTDGYDDFLGMPKKSFHEREEWEGHWR